MIPTVLGPREASSVPGYCSPHERLIHKSSPSDLQAILDTPITLANLAEARHGSDTGRFAVSNKLYSLDESVQELGALVDAGGGLVLACGAVGDGRDPSGLAEIARRSKIGVVMAASWQWEERGSKEQPSPETVGRELEGQLLFGEHAAKDVASAASATASSRIQAGFIVVNLPDSSTSSGMPRASADLPSDILKALEGAAWAQRATAAPLVIVCSHFVRWRHIESALAIATAHWASEPTSRLNSKVIVAGMHGGISQSLQDQVAILERGAVLCFDCFGRVEWLSGPEYYPSDEESSVRIAELVRQGFADQVVISQWVSRRIHLSRCGGYGYGHALRTVPPRLKRLGVSEDDVSLITRGNILRLMDWYTPPPPLEAPKEYLPCSWCKKRFEPIEGEYFHKFQFVYCGVKCLRKHRDTGFDAGRVGAGE